MEEASGKGIGKKLVAACIDEARALGLKKVFALTYLTPYFEKLNFKPISKDILTSNPSPKIYSPTRYGGIVSSVSSSLTVMKMRL
jgi:N-acetylglutamate synthase-like GNAT family acetyltransferase